MNLKEPLVCKIKQYEIVDGARLTVACTGDLHISPIVSEKQQEYLKDTFETIKPDYIILQGDLVDSPEYLDDDKLRSALMKTMRLCSATATTLMVLGNHDIILPKHGKVSSIAEFKKYVLKDSTRRWRRICAEANVKLLCDEWFETDNVAFFGFYQDESCMFKGGRWQENISMMKKKLDSLVQSEVLHPKDDKLNWFISHAPLGRLIDSPILSGFKVMTFGHTHGGCVPVGIDTIFDKIGFTGGLIAPFKKPFPLKNMRGCRTLENGTKMIVNTGMILTQECAPKPLQSLNFLKAAEVTEIKVGYE